MLACVDADAAFDACLAFFLGKFIACFPVRRVRAAGAGGWAAWMTPELVWMRARVTPRQIPCGV